jgi:hypothetical protein
MKLTDQWLNEALRFVSSSMAADSFVLRNRQLLLAADPLLDLKKYSQNDEPLNKILKS